MHDCKKAYIFIFKKKVRGTESFAARCRVRLTTTKTKGCTRTNWLPTVRNNEVQLDQGSYGNSVGRCRSGFRSSVFCPGSGNSGKYCKIDSSFK
ncbi:hypothetical protein CVS40_11072 [Lucilia cuprina]|nr:hypothetical protein CVS40_11072 [Lucilia cuprina]